VFRESFQSAATHLPLPVFRIRNLALHRLSCGRTWGHLGSSPVLIRGKRGTTFCPPPPPLTHCPLPVCGSVRVLFEVALPTVLTILNFRNWRPFVCWLCFPPSVVYDCRPPPPKTLRSVVRAHRLLPVPPPPHSTTLEPLPEQSRGFTRIKQAVSLPPKPERHFNVCQKT